MQTIKPYLILIFFLLLQTGNCMKNCQNENRAITFYKIKSCHRSTGTITYWKRVTSLKECKMSARDRNGLAFNFSPDEAVNVSKSYLPNCQVLACPQIGNDSSLVSDPAFDYYSAYGNLNLTQNATCIQSVGIFTLTNDYYNYTQSILSCQNASGDLADITSEYRTQVLSQIIKENLSDWYKAVYVGLDDINIEGIFQTSVGKFLTCSKYRGWAPGHPRSKHSAEDCVTLDSDKLWRVVKCNKVKLRALCEFYPQPPNLKEKVPRNVTCGTINGKGKRRKCQREKELFDIYKNASRKDKCAILNFE